MERKIVELKNAETYYKEKNTKINDKISDLENTESY